MYKLLCLFHFIFSQKSVSNQTFCVGSMVELHSMRDAAFGSNRISNWNVWNDVTHILSVKNFYNEKLLVAEKRQKIYTVRLYGYSRTILTNNSLSCWGLFTIARTFYYILLSDDWGVPLIACFLSFYLFMFTAKISSIIHVTRPAFSRKKIFSPLAKSIISFGVPMISILLL